MKALIFAILISFSSMASTIKVCKTKILTGNYEKTSVVLEFKKSRNVLSAIFTQKLDGFDFTLESLASIESGRVRAGLSQYTRPDTLNAVEKMVVLAMKVEAHKPYQGRFKAGFPLKKVRSATAYYTASEPSKNYMVVLEGRDASGKVLGSFFGHDVIYPCL